MDKEQLNALFGMDTTADHAVGEHIWFLLDNGPMCSGKILHIQTSAPAWQGGPVLPVSYWVDTGTGFPEVVYPSQIIEKKRS